MRKLTVRKKISEGEFKYLEDTYSIKLSQEFKDFMQIYANSGVEESVYISQAGDRWILSSFCPYKTMYEWVGEFLKYNLGTRVPFGFDLGGWIFCISLEEYEYNSVYIYRFTDHLPKDAFLKIADSFEEFINSLHPEEVIS